MVAKVMVVKIVAKLDFIADVYHPFIPHFTLVFIFHFTLPFRGHFIFLKITFFLSQLSS